MNRFKELLLRHKPIIKIYAVSAIPGAVTGLALFFFMSTTAGRLSSAFFYAGVIELIMGIKTFVQAGVFANAYDFYKHKRKAGHIKKMIDKGFLPAHTEMEAFKSPVMLEYKTNWPGLPYLVWGVVCILVYIILQ